MTDLEHLLSRQAQWQRSRQSLTWPEKIRQAERVLDSVRQWRARTGPGGSTTDGSPERHGKRAVIDDRQTATGEQPSVNSDR